MDKYWLLIVLLIAITSCEDNSNRYVNLPGLSVREGESTFELAMLYEEMNQRRTSLIASSRYFASFSMTSRLGNGKYIYTIDEGFSDVFKHLDLTAKRKYKIGRCDSYVTSEAELDREGVSARVICSGMLLDLELNLLGLKNKYFGSKYSDLVDNIEVQQALRHKAHAIEKHSEFVKPIRQLDLAMIELLHEIKMIIGANEYVNGGNKDIPEKINLLLEKFNINQYQIDESSKKFKEEVYEQYWNLE